MSIYGRFPKNGERFPIQKATIPVSWQGNHFDNVHKLNFTGGDISLSKDGDYLNIETGGYVYNVRAYGATGDGVTDDTSAFEAVVAALKVSNGGKVYIPAGTYKCTRPIVWPYHYGAIAIEGDGAKSIIYYTATDGTDCWKIPQWLNKTEGNTTDRTDMRFIIRDLMIIGAGKAQTGTGNGITIYSTWMVTIDSVTVWRFGGGAGINNQGGQNVGIYRSYLAENKYGVHLRDAYPYNLTVEYYGLNSNNVGMRDCQMQHNVSHGVYISIPSGGSRAIQTVIDNCIIQGNGGAAVYAEDFSFLTIRNCYFETNVTAEALADIYTEGGYWLTVENCESHVDTGVSLNSVSVDLNGVSQAWFRQNSWVEAYYRNTSGNIYTFQASGANLVDASNYSRYFSPNVDIHFADQDATPTVSFHNLYFCDNTVATTITGFDDGQIGQEITIFFTTANTTIQYNSNIRLSGNKDWTPDALSALRLVKYPGYNWVEIGRMSPVWLAAGV